jgi:hypothetical protein
MLCEMTNDEWRDREGAWDDDFVHEDSMPGPPRLFEPEARAAPFGKAIIALRQIPLTHRMNLIPSSFVIRASSFF